MGETDKTIDTERIKKAVKEILLAVGEDPDREGLVDTPDRVARMYGELLGGAGTAPGLDQALHPGEGRLLRPGPSPHPRAVH